MAGNEVKYEQMGSQYFFLVIAVMREIYLYLLPFSTMIREVSVQVKPTAMSALVTHPPATGLFFSAGKYMIGALL